VLIIIPELRAIKMVLGTVTLGGAYDRR